MIYIISNGENIKIGKSKTPRKRMQSLQTASPTNLRFKYIFDIPDSYEKKLHKLFNKFKTDTNNEWFWFEDGDLGLRLLRLGGLFKEEDLQEAVELANKINDSIYKGRNGTGGRMKGSPKYKQIPYANKILKHIRHHLKHKPKVRISYSQYINKYKVTSNEISYYVKSAKLGKAVYLHNSKLEKKNK